MSQVNFHAIKEHVSTQYGDLTGVIQLDGHENITSIYDLCVDYKFDTSDKFIIGFGLGESTTDGIGRENSVSCYILYVDKDEYGDSYDEIESKLKSGYELSLKKKNIYIKYTDLGKYIKRFEFIAVIGLTRYSSTIDIVDIEDDDE